MRALLLSGLLDSITFIAGHTGYESGVPRGESRGPDGGGGIGTASIVAVLLVILAAVALLAWLDPSGTRSKLKTVAPALPIAAIIVMPLVVWAASSGGDERTLIVERATSVTGAPQFIVSLADEDLNSLETTHGRRTVRVECLDRDGDVVLDAKRRWPFVNNEPGYDYPHLHQAASREQLQRADRCRLRGAGPRLEADVEGSLTG